LGRSARGFPRARSQRRKTAWTDGTGGTTPTAVTGSVAGFLGSALVFTQEAVTLIRIRGYFRGMLLTSNAAAGGFSGAVGIGIASTAAVTAGIASVPTPIAEQESENWLYWHAFNMNSVTSTIADGVNSVGYNFELVVDSKAMRKAPPDLTFYAAFEVVESGTATSRIWHDSRFLALLP